MALSPPSGTWMAEQELGHSRIFVGVVLLAAVFIKGFGVKVEEGRPGGG